MKKYYTKTFKHILLYYFSINYTFVTLALSVPEAKSIPVPVLLRKTTVTVLLELTDDTIEIPCKSLEKDVDT